MRGSHAKTSRRNVARQLCTSPPSMVEALPTSPAMAAITVAAPASWPPMPPRSSPRPLRTRSAPSPCQSPVLRVWQAVAFGPVPGQVSVAARARLSVTSVDTHRPLPRRRALRRG